MSTTVRPTVRGCLTAGLVGAALLVPAGTSQATDQTLRDTIKTYDPTIATDEGNLLSAEGKFAKDHDPAALHAAIQQEITDLGALRLKLGADTASTKKGREGRVLVMRGLNSIITAYRRLDRAVGDTNKAKAKQDALKAQSAAKKGRAQLAKGAKLLGI
jgi:hypothetical protein